MHTKRILFIYGSVIFMLNACSQKKETPAITEDKKTDSIPTSVVDTATVFTWENGLCYNIGKYEKGKYDATTLKNTYDLWYGATGIELEQDGTASTPEDIEKLNIEALTSEYEKKKAFFSTATFIEGAYWEKLKALRLKELEDEYELKKITIQAYENPSVLKNNRFSKTCPEYVQALTAKDTSTLFKAWKKFAEKQKLNHGSPEEYMRNFSIKWNSPQKLEFAKVDLITYGWWNCVNATIRSSELEETDYEAAFKKLFVSVGTQCDEP